MANKATKQPKKYAPKLALKDTVAFDDLISLSLRTKDEPKPKKDKKKK